MIWYSEYLRMCCFYDIDALKKVQHRGYRVTSTCYGIADLPLLINKELKLLIHSLLSVQSTEFGILYYITLVIAIKHHP